MFKLLNNLYLYPLHFSAIFGHFRQNKKSIFLEEKARPNLRRNLTSVINDFISIDLLSIFTAWKMSKYGVISGPYFPRTRNNSVFRHFSCTVLKFFLQLLLQSRDPVFQSIDDNRNKEFLNHPHLQKTELNELECLWWFRIVRSKSLI